LQAICMPFLGRVTLARAAARLAEQAARPTAGRDLADPTSTQTPDALRAVARLSFVDGVFHLVAQLAGGLAHDHARHILHRDLKPANVLVTADGVPMILDFNVSSESARASADGRIGGTLPYMRRWRTRRFPRWSPSGAPCPRRRAGGTPRSRRPATPSSSSSSPPPPPPATSGPTTCATT